MRRKSELVIYLGVKESTFGPTPVSNHYLITIDDIGTKESLYRRWRSNITKRAVEFPLHLGIRVSMISGSYSHYVKQLYMRSMSELLSGSELDSVPKRITVLDS